MDDAVGVVFGNVSTVEFRFAVRDPALRRTDYVQVNHPTDGPLVAQVVDVTRETSLGYEEATRAGHHDAARRDHLVGRARLLGFRDSRGLVQAPRTPVPSGADVRRADPLALAHLFGLTADDGAYVGLVKGHDLKVHLDVNTLVQKHASVLAKTGSGKSYVVGVLMEELVKKGVPIVVVDPHGEHGSLARPNNSAHEQPARRRFAVTPRNYGEHIVEYSPDTDANPGAIPFHLEGTGLDARDIADVLDARVTSAQMGLLQTAVRALRERGDEYSLADVLEEVRAAGTNAKWNLVSAMETLVGVGLFASPGTSIESLVQPRKVSILNLKGVAPEMQRMLVALTARHLFEARKVGKVPPFMLVVEEAHNFAPERGMGSALSGEVLRTVASEGRKFGMGLTVVSQRPAKVDKNVLSQCNTQIILKVTNPNDLRALAASVEGFTPDSEDEIQRLPVGVAFVSHPRLALPLLVEVRPRETSHGGESVDVMASLHEEDDPPRVRPPRAAERHAAPENDETEDDEAEALRPAPAVARRTPAPTTAPQAAPVVPRVDSMGALDWVAEVREEERYVARADLAALSLDHLSRLEKDLAEHTRALARAAPELGREGAALRSRLDGHLRRLHELIEAREREGRGFGARVRALANAATRARKPRMESNSDEAARRPPRRVDLSASRGGAKRAKQAAPKKPAKKKAKKGAAKKTPPTRVKTGAAIQRAPVKSKTPSAKRRTSKKSRGK